MLGPKEKSILQYLYQYREGYTTSQELARHLSCSDRTVRTYVKALTEQLQAWPAIRLTAKQGQGYRLEVLDEEAYSDLVADSRLDISDRHQYILNKLIFEQEALFFDDLAEELYVSRSTLSADFRKIRQELAQYQLTVVSKAGKGVCVQGSERDKRRFIMDYFFSGHFQQNIHQYVGDAFFQLPISFEELTIIVLDECRSQGLRLSDFVLQNLIVHIALAIQRVKAGFELSDLTLDLIRYRREVGVAAAIVSRLSRAAGLAFPEEEVSYIALHLISEGLEKPEGSDDSLRRDLLQAAQEIDRHYGYAFSQDFTFIEGLLPHLEILLERVRHKIRLDNPLLEDIQRQYRPAFVIAASLAAHLEHFEGYPLSDDEVAYISLHILAAMERHQQAKKFNALVICATGYGSAQMLRARLEKELGRQIHIADLVGYYDLSDEKLEGIDLIISTIDLSTLVFSVPVFTVSVFLKDEEVRRLKAELDQLEASQETTFPPAAAPGRLSDHFDRYFSAAYFRRYSSTDKETVLADLLTAFYGEDGDRKAAMLELIRRREAMSSVVFDETIAVPHPIKPLDKRPRIGLALIEEGISWDAHFKGIRLVFLVSPSVCSNEGLAELTKRIVELTDLPELKEKLIACRDFSGFRQLFLEST